MLSVVIFERVGEKWSDIVLQNMFSCRLLNKVSAPTIFQSYSPQYFHSHLLESSNIFFPKEFHFIYLFIKDVSTISRFGTF